MKILVLIHEFPPVGGGGGRVARDLAIGLAQRGHEIRILTAAIEGAPATEILNNNVRVERILPMRKSAFQAGLIEMGKYDLSAVRRGKTILREWKPDLIHAHFAVPAGAAALALTKMSGIPYVLTAHLGDVPGAVPEKTDAWFQWVYPFTPPIWRNAARVVAVSEFTRRMALKHYNVPIQVIPNGVDSKALPVSIRKPVGAPLRLVFAGRFMEQKNPADLIQALISLQDLPWHCSMLGDGPLLEPLRETIRQKGLVDRFNLPGWVTPEQVLDEFSRSDLLVLPSRSEGLSVVGVQALAMGLALVLSNAGGNLELVNQGENGFLFPVGAVDVLTESLRKLISQPSLLQAAQSKSLEMAKKYELASVITQYEEVFLGL